MVIERSTSVWAQEKEVPPKGAYCLDTDTLRIKLANGRDRYSALPFADEGGETEWVDPPAQSNSPGQAGQKAYDGTYLYLCSAEDTWHYIELSEGAWP